MINILLNKNVKVVDNIYKTILGNNSIKYYNDNKTYNLLSINSYTTEIISKFKNSDYFQKQQKIIKDYYKNNKKKLAKNKNIIEIIMKNIINRSINVQNELMNLLKLHTFNKEIIDLIQDENYYINELIKKNKERKKIINNYKEYKKVIKIIKNADIYEKWGKINGSFIQKYNNMPNRPEVTSYISMNEFYYLVIEVEKEEQYWRVNSYILINNIYKESLKKRIPISYNTINYLFPDDFYKFKWKRRSWSTSYLARKTQKITSIKSIPMIVERNKKILNTLHNKYKGLFLYNNRDYLSKEKLDKIIENFKFKYKCLEESY